MWLNQLLNFMLLCNFSFERSVRSNHSNRISNDNWTSNQTAPSNDVTNDSCHVTAGENVMEQIFHINTCQGTNIDDQFTGFDVKRSPDHVNRQRRAVVFDEKYKWKQSEDGLVYIPYIISSEITNQVAASILLAIQDFTQKTCIRFVERNSETDFVFIFSSNLGCWSHIGKQGGRNDLSMDPQCNSKGIAIHELMHVLGYGHEQGRRDRDQYITIHWGNILSRFRNQFAMDAFGERVVFGTEYDDQSVMHYGNTLGGATSDTVTISSKQDPTRKFGQRLGFSPLDIREINLKYKCGRKYVSYD